MKGPAKGPAKGGRLAISAVPIGGGRVLLQVDDRWHLVVGAADATRVADMLHRAAHGTPMAGTVTDLHVTDSDIPDGGNGHPA